MTREQLRTRLAIAFCLSQLLWVDPLLKCFNDIDKEIIGFPLIFIVIPGIACLITQNWTIHIGALSGYCSGISIAWFVAPEPWIPWWVLFAAEAIFMSPVWSVYSFVASVPVALIRHWKHKRDPALDSPAEQPRQDRTEAPGQ